MILGGGKLKLRGGNPPFPRVLYETLAGLCVCVCVHYICALTSNLFTGLVGRAIFVCVHIMSVL